MCSSVTMVNYVKAALTINEARAELNKGAELDDVVAKFAEGGKLAEGNHKLVAMAETGQAEAHIRRKDFAKAEEHLSRALVACDKVETAVKTITRANFMQALAFCGAKKFDEAVKLFDKSKQTAEAGDLPKTVLDRIDSALAKAKDKSYTDEEVVDTVTAYSKSCESEATAPEQVNSETDENMRKRKVSGSKTKEDESETPEKKAREAEKVSDKAEANSDKPEATGDKPDAEVKSKEVENQSVNNTEVASSA